MKLCTACLVTALTSGLVLVAANSALAQGSGLKLVRYGELGVERPGLIDASGTLRDLSGHIDDITPDVLSREGLARLAAIEGNFEIPEEPVLFFKSITSLNGPDDTVVLPKNSVNSDFEVELGIVMGPRLLVPASGDAKRATLTISRFTSS